MSFSKDRPSPSVSWFCNSGKAASNQEMANFELLAATELIDIIPNV